MERDKINSINESFKLKLFFWQGLPEDPVVINDFNDFLAKSAQEGFNLALRIKAETFENSDGRRAIQRGDLNKLAKREGDFYTFRFKPNKENGKYGIFAANIENQPLLLIFEGEKDKRVWMAAFRPHEIDSFFVW